MNDEQRDTTPPPAARPRRAPSPAEQPTVVLPSQPDDAAEAERRPHEVGRSERKESEKAPSEQTTVVIPAQHAARRPDKPRPDQNRPEKPRPERSRADQPEQSKPGPTRGGWWDDAPVGEVKTPPVASPRPQQPTARAERPGTRPEPTTRREHPGAAQPGQSTSRREHPGTTQPSESATRAEQAGAWAEQSATRGERPGLHPDQRTARGDQPTSRVEQPASRGEESTFRGERSGGRREVAVSRGEGGAPGGGKSLGDGSWKGVVWPLPRPLVKRIALGAAVGVVGVAAFAGLRQLADAPASPAGPSGSPQPSQTSTTPDEAAEGVRRAVAGEAVLQKMADAVRAENRTEFLATIDPQAKTFDGQARTIYSNLGKLPLATFQLRYVSDDPGALEPARTRALGGTKSWLAQVEVSWQLTGYDAKPARETLPVTFVTRDGTTYAASFSERFVAGQRRPIWALGSIDVARSEHSLVVSLDSQSDADDYADVTDRAVDSVSDVWGRKWRQKAVIYLPSKQSQMESVLGAPPGTYTQIAAVTMAELDTPQAGAPVRIVANPKLFDELGKQGRRIVLTHETTHVASTATASPVPLWLAEGFADYVAFTAVSVQDESAAKELFKAIRAGKVPKALPPTEAFAASSTELPQAYESGWLACRLIAEREGQSKLVKFYRTVHASKSPTGLADAFRTVLGTTEQQFVADWQNYIKRLAGV